MDNLEFGYFVIHSVTKFHECQKFE